MAEFSAPIGTRDILPPESSRWAELTAQFYTRFAAAGYGLIMTPLFEDLGVFHRIGEATDVVTKEMYDFTDKGGRRIALRPENTAAVVRSFVEHRPVTPWKVIYAGPMFRYEAPQAGRYRQFHQYGAEVLGTLDPDVDVEVIALLDGFYRSVGLRQFRLVINSLGDRADRLAYVETLRTYFTARAGELSEQSRATLLRNPLRVLDSKRREDAKVVAEAPRSVDHLSDDAGAHFERVLAGLDRVGVAYEVSPRLVRGLDYYTRTTFEFASDSLGTAQNALGGGGRYDGLAEELGGPSTPSIGFAAGIERILLALDAELVEPAASGAMDVFVVDTTGGSEALALSFELRAAGLSADRAYDGRSMKAQMKAADRCGASVAVLVGSDELAAGEVTLRPMGGGEQVRVRRDDVVAQVKAMLS